MICYSIGVCRWFLVELENHGERINEKKTSCLRNLSDESFRCKKIQGWTKIYVFKKLKFFF